MLSEARTVRVGVANLRAKVKGLLEGLEPEVALVVDVNAAVVTAGRRDAGIRCGISDRCPAVAVEALGAVAQLVSLPISVSASRATAMFRDLSGSGSAVWT